MINWDNVDARHFEKFIFHVLGRKGFKIVNGMVEAAVIEEEMSLQNII